jgi:hypothetical protein
VAAPAAGRGIDILARGRVALAASASASASGVAAPARLGRDGALYVLGLGGGRLLAAAAGCKDERENREGEDEDARHRGESIPAAVAT